MCTNWDKMKADYQAKYSSLRSRPFHFPSAQDTRNPVSISRRREDLCGWELSQLFLLHDDSGIVEWFSEEEHQIFSSSSKAGWSCSLFGYVPFSDNILKLTHKDLPEIRNTISDQSQEIRETRNNFSNLYRYPEMKPLVKKKIIDREDKELKFFSNKFKPNNRAKAEMYEGRHAYTSAERNCEGDPHLTDTHSERLNQVFKIRNLEEKLAANRTSKINKRVGDLRQPLATKTTNRLLKRELFNPSVISVMGTSALKSPGLPTEDQWEKRLTNSSSKKYLQLLPIDSAVRLRKPTDTQPIKTKTVLPRLDVQRSFLQLPKRPCDQLKCKTFHQAAVQRNIFKTNLIKPEFLVQQTRQDLPKEHISDIYMSFDGPEQEVSGEISRQCTAE